jgi:hypothetical protein
MSNIYLPRNASKARLRDAENARKNRLEIVKAYSQGQISRRDMFKWGLVTAGGLIAPIGGLSPFVRSSRADSIPTGAAPSNLFGAQPFSQPMLRHEVLSPKPALCIDDPSGGPNMVVSAAQSGLRGNDAERRSCQEKMNVDAALGGGVGPCEGRPFDPRPGQEDYFAHQFWHDFEPKVAYDVSQMPAVAGQVKFHPSMPAQNANSVWTFNGTIPPKLVLGRYGEPILFRHHNELPRNVKDNNGFGRHTISTHEHNGHHGYENDGFTGAFFYPGQYYDYHWPIKLAGFSAINKEASDPRAGGPADNGTRP